jgi:hypothetical protein
MSFLGASNLIVEKSGMGMFFGAEPAGAAMGGGW